MGTVTNKRKVLFVKGKVKVIREIDNRKMKLMCFGNSVS